MLIFHTMAVFREVPIKKKSFIFEGATTIEDEFSAQYMHTRSVVALKLIVKSTPADAQDTGR